MTINKNYHIKILLQIII